MKKRFKSIVAMIIVSSNLITVCNTAKIEDRNSTFIITANAESVNNTESENTILKEKALKIIQKFVSDEVDIFQILQSKTDEKIPDIKTEIKPLPQSISDNISYQKNKYPNMKIAIGIYSLDGKEGYEYNEKATISGGCTIKAPYALYVLKQCKEQNIDIETERLTYKEGMRNDGSGIIKNAKYGTSYTISYLLEKLLDISDNTAYNILVSRFPLNQYQKFLDDIGGQQLYGRQYGVASVIQRKNEWLTIYKYINSHSKYSETLRKYLTNTKYCYITDWMKNEHNYMHKSGWSSGKNYTCACDCAIIDENYLLIVFTEDYKTHVAHTDVVRSIGLSVENYANSLGGYIF